MKRFIPFVVFYLLCAISLQAAEKTLLLQDFILGLEKNCAAFRENIINLAKAEAAYKEGKAVMYPVISISAPINYQYMPQNVLFTVSDVEVKSLNSTSVAVAPEVTLSQYLPTAGTLGVSFKNSFSQINMGELSPPEYTTIAEQQDYYINGIIYKNTPNLTISYSQPLTLENSYQAGLSLIESSYAIAKSNYRNFRNLLIYNAVKSYTNLQYLKAALALSESANQSADNAYKETDQNYRLGRITRITLLKAQASLKKALLELNTARDTYKIAFQQFCRTYGIEEDVLIPDDISPAVFPVIPDNEASILDDVMKNNAELQIIGHKRDISRANLSRAKAEDVLTLGLGAHCSFDTTENSVNDPGRAFLSPFSEYGNPALSFSITLSGKLFDGNARQEKIKQAALDLQIAELSLTEKKDDLQNQASHLLSIIQNNNNTREYQKINLEIAELEYNNGKKDLELGLISKVDFQSLARNLDTVRLSLLQAQNDYWLAGLELFILTGADLWAYFQKGNV